MKRRVRRLQTIYGLNEYDATEMKFATLTKGLLKEECLEKEGEPEWLWLTRELLKLLAKTSEQSLKENTAHSNARYAMAD